jgi:hypothetical protein
MPGQRVEILAHRFAGANAETLSASVAAIQPDENGKSNRWSIEVSAREGAANVPFEGLLVLTTGDPQYPSVEVPVTKRATAP